jgi:hypothetical protein
MLNFQVVNEAVVSAGVVPDVDPASLPASVDVCQPRLDLLETRSAGKRSPQLYSLQFIGPKLKILLDECCTWDGLLTGEV